MILMASQRTDIVGCYSPWLLRRLAEGFVLVRNPYNPATVSRYLLDRRVTDCLVLCSKNYAPLLPDLAWADSRIPLLCFGTVTAYGRDLEPGVPDIFEAARSLRAVSGIVGKERTVWRYDPVLLTARYTAERHFEIFEKLCRLLAPHVDRCVMSFLHPFPLQARRRELRLLDAGEKERLARGLGAIAERFGLPLQSCAGDREYTEFGIRPAGCLTRVLLERALGVPFAEMPAKNLRPGCRCVESRDLGAYDTCSHGCRYCYATASPEALARNREAHDPSSPLLTGGLRPGDRIVETVQKSFRLTRIPPIVPRLPGL